MMKKYNNTMNNHKAITMNRKEKTILFFLAVLVLGAVIYSTNQLLFNSLLTWQIQQTPYHLMLMELVLVFFLFFAAGLFLPAKLNFLAILAILSVFLWAHQILLPLAVSGLYAAWLWLLGRWLLRCVIARSSTDPSHAFSYDSLGKAFSREFLLGSLFTICCFCLMSALGIGRIENLWIFILNVTALLALDFPFWKQQVNGIRLVLFPQLNTHPKTLNQRRVHGRNALVFAVLLTLFCLQAGRMNTSVDFDSIWYGTRSPYILNNGGGIYENLGTIGVVYTYSKGLEVLTLPLSILPSYSFLISFNLWLAAGVLVQSWMIGRFYLQKSAAQIMLCFLASLPGIMNMGITAKSDMATLYIQLMMIHELLCFLKGERLAFWYAFGAFFFSWTLKPTAMVFSTAIMGMSVLFLLFNSSKFTPAPPLPRTASGTASQRQPIIHLESRRYRSRKGIPESVKSRRGAFITFIFSLIALTGIWARTFLITGLPVTSVFSSVLTRIGFTMKYPFNAKPIPNNTIGAAPQERLASALGRIYGVLLNPQDKDLDHVIIAWGSLGAWFLLCLCLAWIFFRKRNCTGKERMMDSYLNTIFLPLLACCLISLLMLYQVDGNYFMLFYVLSALCIFRLTERLFSQRAAKMIHGLTVPVILFSAVITTLTSWAWSLGFTPIAWKHKGYYPHQEIQHQEMIDAGNGEIWEILSQNPRNRLISIGDHPQSLVFPCNAQSFRDITKNAWGNPVLAETAENFVEFMDYAKTDYIYAQAGYLTPDSQAWELLCACIVQGKLTPLCYEEGNMLAYVDVHGIPEAECYDRLEEFMTNYKTAVTETP